MYRAEFPHPLPDTPVNASKWCLSTPVSPPPPNLRGAIPRYWGIQMAASVVKVDIVRAPYYRILDLGRCDSSSGAPLSLLALPMGRWDFGGFPGDVGRMGAFFSRCCVDVASSWVGDRPRLAPFGHRTFGCSGGPHARQRLRHAVALRPSPPHELLPGCREIGQLAPFSTMVVKFCAP